MKKPATAKPKAKGKAKGKPKGKSKAKAKSGSNKGKNKKVKDGDGDKPTLKRPAASEKAEPKKAEPKKGQGSSSKGAALGQRHWTRRKRQVMSSLRKKRWSMTHVIPTLPWTRVRNLKPTRRTGARTPSSKGYLRNTNFQVGWRRLTMPHSP